MVGMQFFRDGAVRMSELFPNAEVQRILRHAEARVVAIFSNKN